MDGTKRYQPKPWRSVLFDTLNLLPELFTSTITTTSTYQTLIPQIDNQSTNLIVNVPDNNTKIDYNNYKKSLHQLPPPPEPKPRKSITKLDKSFRIITIEEKQQKQQQQEMNNKRMMLKKNDGDEHNVKININTNKEYEKNVKERQRPISIISDHVKIHRIQPGEFDIFNIDDDDDDQQIVVTNKNDSRHQEQHNKLQPLSSSSSSSSSKYRTDKLSLSSSHHYYQKKKIKNSFFSETSVASIVTTLGATACVLILGLSLLIFIAVYWIMKYNHLLPGGIMICL